MEAKPLLERLTQAHGVAGYEGDVRAVVREVLGPLVDEMRVDALGNVIAVKRGTGAEPRRRLLLAGHMDEIGMAVVAQREAMLQVTTIGGIDPRTVLGQEVVVHGKRRLRGILGSRPPHVVPLEARSKPVPIQELYVDTGLSAEAVRELVSVGDVVSIRGDFTELVGGAVASKAMDDRAGVAAVILAVDHLSRMEHSWDVVAVATTQEERGLLGATVAGYGVVPDAAIAVDVGFAKQQGVGDHESIALDGGPAIAWGANAHPVMARRLGEVAEAWEIPHQQEFIPGRSGTDAWALQVTRSGVPTAVVSIPLRYMHTVVELLTVRDLERTGRLLAAFAASLDEGTAQEMGLAKEVSA